MQLQLFSSTHWSTQMNHSHPTTISIARLGAFVGLARLFQSVQSINGAFVGAHKSTRQTHSQAQSTAEQEPLLRFGPGGSFVSNYHGFRGGLMVVAGHAPAGQKSLVREVSDWMERVLGIRRLRWAQHDASTLTPINHTVQEPIVEIAPPHCTASQVASPNSPSVTFNTSNFISSGNAGPSPWRHGRWSAQLSFS